MASYWFEHLCNINLTTEEMDAIYSGLRKVNRVDVADRFEEWLKWINSTVSFRKQLELNIENQKSYENYSPELTKEDWINFLKDEEIVSKDSIDLIDRLYTINKPTEPEELSKVFGYGRSFYVYEAERIAKRILRKTDKKIPILYYKRAESLKAGIIDEENLWAIIYKPVGELYQLRDEIAEAYKEVYKK